MNDVLHWRVAMNVVLGGIFLAAAILLISRVTGYLTRYLQWERVSAVYQKHINERTIEVEFMREDEPVRRQVEVSSATRYRAAHGAEIALDPADSQRAVAMDLRNLGRRLTNPLAFLVVAVIAWINLAKVPWGQDRTWSNGEWVLTPGQAAPAIKEPGAIVLRETRGVQGFQLLMLVLFGVFAVGATYGILRYDAGIPTLNFILSAAGACIFAGILIDSRSLQLVMSEVGITQQTFFGVQRIPWAVIDSIKSRNINEAAQKAYMGSSARLQKGSSSPPTIRVDFIVDAQQREIISLSDQMEPPEALKSLKTKIRQLPSAGRR